MKKKRDILFLCQFFYPEYVSSATLPYDTARALQKAGYTVDALCGYPREYAQQSHLPKRETVDGMRIHRLRYLQLQRSSFLGRLVNYLSFTAQVLLHLGELAKYRAVVVYSNPPILPWLAVWAKKLFGTKLVFVAYDLYPEMAVRTCSLRDGSLICRLMNHINRRVYPNADLVVVLSGEMKEFVLENRKIPPEKVAVIPNWYSDEGNTVMNKRGNRFRRLVGERFVVSYFGNMGTMQDMQTILDAAKLLKEENIFFLFAGHGNKFDQVKAFFAREGMENAAVFPFLHGEDFQDALAISDCALVSLEANTTGLCVPSKTYSYMMRGLPLIAIMDESDIVRDITAGAGVWVRNGESRSLAEKIRTMREDPDRLAAMGKICRRLYCEKYTTEICTQKYINCFRGLLAPDKGDRGNEHFRK